MLQGWGRDIMLALGFDVAMSKVREVLIGRTLGSVSKYVICLIMQRTFSNAKLSPLLHTNGSSFVICGTSCD